MSERAAEAVEIIGRLGRCRAEDEIMKAYEVLERTPTRAPLMGDKAVRLIPALPRVSPLLDAPTQKNPVTTMKSPSPNTPQEKSRWKPFSNRILKCFQAQLQQATDGKRPSRTKRFGTSATPLPLVKSTETGAPEADSKVPPLQPVKKIYYCLPPIGRTL